MEFHRGTLAMPIAYARRLTARHRSAEANLHLGLALAFVAGAANAGGFLAVNQYTSHMTGIVSSMAGNIGLGTYTPVLGSAGALLSFVAGAACSAIMVNYARRRRLHSVYALPMLFESFLLLCFGVLGGRLTEVRGLFVPTTVMLLCFMMGLQNAVITKVSRAEIRTTHITGVITDLGIELGKLAYWNRDASDGAARVVANRGRLRILALLAGFFFTGGIAGAFGFKHVGFLSAMPLAVLVGMLGIVPALDDIAVFARRMGSR
jgi:uncharacterized membrane protein YoaK (UPF0700 family)